MDATTVSSSACPSPCRALKVLFGTPEHSPLLLECDGLTLCKQGRFHTQNITTGIYFVAL